MKKWIRLGDMCDHGGPMITASGHIVNGAKVCVDGDLVMCPKHGKLPVRATSSNVTIGGKRVLRQGDQVVGPCFSRLVGGSPNTQSD
jgi:uncharacterized Zn-binding protein involved in type VI secretion